MENTLLYYRPGKLAGTSFNSFDLPDVIDKIKQKDSWKVSERNTITLLSSPHMRIALIALHGQTEINFHQSGNMVSVQLIEGVVNFQTEKQSVMLKKGSLLTFQADMRHTLIAIEESVFLLTIADTHGSSLMN